MNKLHLVLLASPAIVVLAASAHSFVAGALPGTSHPLYGTIPATIASSAPGCYQCHVPDPSAPPVVVAVQPSKRSLALNEAISMSTSATGGVPHVRNWGGFITEVTAGLLAAGATSAIDPTGKFVTHAVSTTGNRNWSYGYTAPATPGLVKVYAAVNTVNGDVQPTGDAFGFHNDPTGAVSVPVRLYANAQNVTQHGAGCIGSLGNWPVLGALTPPKIGTTHTLEVHGAAPAQPITLFLGTNPSFALPLDFLGITGCTLYVQSLISLNNLTSPGSAQNGDGSASWAIPLPNDPMLINATFETQAALLDPLNGRPLPVTLTNALSSQIF